MSDDYTNLDLDTADELLVAAGRPELAKALRHQTQGVRNLVQGVWGQSFVATLDNIMDTRVVSVLASVQARLDEQIALVQQMIIMTREANATAHEALTVAKVGAAHIKKVQADMKESQADRRKIHQEVAAVKDDLAVIQARLDRQDEIERRLAALEAHDDGDR